MREFIDIIKNDKRSKILFVITLGVLFVCTLSYSLSMFSNSKEGNVVNIQVNGLSFNMTTNSGESDDRILKLKANTLESFNVILTNLNGMDVKYELIYEVCSDNTCSSTIDKLPDDIVFGISNDSIGKITDTIIVNNKKDIYLLSNNNTNQDYYIKLNLNAGYSWNELALINQIDKYSKDVKFIAYVDGIEQDKFPDSCNYSYTYKTYNNGIETSDSEVTLTCSNGVWDISVKNVPNKVKVWFIEKQGDNLKDYIASLGENEESRDTNGLEYDDTADKNLRYVGSNPNNYVSFNDELWRIIGIFDTYDVDNSGNTLSTHSKKIKLIRAETLGEYAFDVSEDGECYNGGCNGYNVSNLMQELNGDYLNNSLTSNPKWYGKTLYGGDNTSQKEFDKNKVIKTTYQNMIANVVWNTGGILHSDYDEGSAPTLNIYNAERSSNVYTGDEITRTSTWNGKVGLMYWSDYGYSSKDAECRNNLWAGFDVNDSDNFDNIKCKNENWLNIVPEGYDTTIDNSYGWWTMSSFAEFGGNQVGVVSIGVGDNFDASLYSLGVLPALYLKFNVLKVGGDGTSLSPYIISL